MTDNLNAFNSIAPLRNVMAFTTLLNEVQGRGTNVPGMATFYGPSGFGKSTAAIFAANETGAVLVQMKSVWTKKSLLTAILNEIGVPPASTVADMYDQIVSELARTGRALLIDEADHLVRKNSIELIRDIYEGTFCPVILIGEELFPEKLRRWERVHGRMLRWVPAEPVTDLDIDLLRGIYCPGVDIDPALMADLVAASGRSARRVMINLNLIKEQSGLLGRDVMGPADWTATFYTGNAPETRRGLR